MVAAAMTGGDVLIQDAIWGHNRPLLAKLQEMGVSQLKKKRNRIQSDLSRLKAVSVKNSASPRFSNGYASSVYCLDDGSSWRINHD